MRGIDGAQAFAEESPVEILEPVMQVRAARRTQHVRDGGHIRFHERLVNLAAHVEQLALKPHRVRIAQRRGHRPSIGGAYAGNQAGLVLPLRLLGQCEVQGRHFKCHLATWGQFFS